LYHKHSQIQIKLIPQQKSKPKKEEKPSNKNGDSISPVSQ